MSEGTSARNAAPARCRLTCIIDDDASVRTALQRLLISAGLEARTYGSALEFLAAGPVPDGCCVIADIKMHGMTGIELHRRLRAARSRVAFIFVTAHDTAESRREAREAGAVAYFRKPVDDQALIDAIEWAFSQGSGKP